MRLLTFVSTSHSGQSMGDENDRLLPSRAVLGRNTASSDSVEEIRLGRGVKSTARFIKNV